IIDQKYISLRLRKTHVRLDATGGEDRLRHLRGEGPYAPRIAEQVRELCALEPQKTGERDAWEGSRFGYANESIGRNQVRFSRANVGASLDQIRSQTGGHARRHLLIG